MLSNRPAFMRALGHLVNGLYLSGCIMPAYKIETERKIRMFCEVWYGLGVAEERHASQELVATVLFYDEALTSCANDPVKMAMYCTAQNKTLDSLYDRFTSVARAMHAKTEGMPTC